MPCNSNTWVERYVNDWLRQTPSYDAILRAGKKRKRFGQGSEPPPQERGCQLWFNHTSDTDTDNSGDLGGESDNKPNSSNTARSSPDLRYCEMDSFSEPDSQSSRDPVITPLFQTPDIPSPSYSPSLASALSGISVKRRIEVLEFNSIPTLTWHTIPANQDLPDAVAQLMSNLTLAAYGCGSIPLSLKSTLETHPDLVSEAFPSFVWATPHACATDDDLDDPSPTNIRLWELVKDIVQHTRTLSSQRAEKSEYYSLAQKIIRGSDGESSELIVKQVAMARFNPHNLPQETPQRSPTKQARHARNGLTSPVSDVRVDISVEYTIPVATKDNLSLLPFSLLTALKQAYGSSWVFGPYPKLSVVACLAEVKTPFGASRMEAEFQAAVGGVCMIQARMELVDLVRSQDNDVDETLLNFNFPVVTLVVMGDTWYYQIVYLRQIGSCVVLPPRMAGDTITYVGAFKLLFFMQVLREWCLNVYSKDFINLLKVIGAGVGWHQESPGHRL